MATKIVTKNSSTSGSAPLASDLVQGELAVNVTDKRLYTENASGTIVEVGTNPSTLTVTGEITANGGIALGDNDKATFGAGDDLQIYHDGSSSFIKDAGTGNLIIQATDLQIANADNTANYIRAFNGGAVDLRYAGAAKLATTSTGIDVTGNISLPDNGKAIFGAGSDLQIYHDGSNSYIADTGTGGLRLLADADTAIRSADNSTPKAIFGGDVKLYHSGNQKLATTATGIDVTGTATMDGLDLGATTDAASVSTTASDYQLQLGAANSTTGDIGQNISFDSSGTTTASINSYDAGASAATGLAFFTGTSSTLRRFLDINSNGDISFYEDTGTTPKLFWDASAESLGIGTTNPLTSLWVQDSVAQKATFTNDDFVANSAGSTFDISMGATTGSTYTSLRALTTGRNAWGNLVLQEGGGNVGIGTSSPSQLLHLTSSGFAYARFNNSSYTGIDIGQHSNGSIYFNNRDNTSIIMQTNNTERMRISSAGHTTFGTTDLTPADNSVNGTSILSDGRINHNAQSQAALTVGRTGTVGAIVDFRKSGVAVGSISVTASTTAYNTSSDQRLKENIADADDAGSKIDAIQVRKYDWKADGSHQDYGMIAQELQAVAPEAVSGDADSEEMMGVDYSKLVPMLIKEIQSLRNRVAQLEG